MKSTTVILPKQQYEFVKCLVDRKYFANVNEAIRFILLFYLMEVEE